MTTNKNIIYFVYSSEQKKKNEKILEKMSKTYELGYVLINGIYKPYTQISKSPQSNYSDAILVASGEEYKMKYKKPTM